MPTHLSNTTLWRRSIIVRLPTDYLLRGLLAPLAFLVILLGAQITLALGLRATAATTLALYAAWACIPLLIVLRKRRALEYLIRTEQGEPICTHCGYTRDPALESEPCPECGRAPEPIADLRARVYALARWIPHLTTVDSQSIETELRRFVSSERLRFWPRLLGLTAAFVVLYIALVITLTLLESLSPQIDIRPITLALAFMTPLAFVSSYVLLRMRRFLRHMRAWTPPEPPPTTQPR